MEIYYTITTFIFGIIFGSFFNVVGYRLPKGESLISPPSHCTKCNHRLKPIELVPVFSYIFLKGKCKVCGQKISLFYPIFELATGILFSTSYLIFGLNIDFLIAITFISTLLIIIISDYQTMIIPDELLIFSGIVLLIELFVKGGLDLAFTSFLNGVIAFTIMFLLKKFGDFLFKKESMGGGDIKLMLLFGFVLGYQTTILSIFFASLIGLPVSLFILFRKKEDIIPFGPFLAVSAILILLTKIDFNFLLNLYGI
ncbi:MAG: prepilin peptidase [Bacilli bacterium]